MNEPTIHSTRSDSLTDFLQLKGFNVEAGGDDVLRVVRDGELPTFVKITDTSLFFEVDLGSLKEIGSSELYFKLLDANSDILPVSFGIDSSNPEEPRLVLLESRLHGDLCDDEILGVFDALELAADTAEKLLQPFIS